MDISDSMLQFEFYLNNITDPRVAKWLFVSSPIPTIAILILYLLTVCFIGPQYMAKRYVFDIVMLLIKIKTALCLKLKLF